MLWRLIAHALLVAMAIAGAVAARASTAHYVLTAESHIASHCDDCEPAAPESLSGSFDVTAMPLSADHALEAVTAVAWRSPSVTVTGTGFLQRLGNDRMTMVVDARLNGLATLLTSGRRQRSTVGEIRMQLSTPKGARSGYTLTIVAVPVATSGPDGDHDGVADGTDNCPNTGSLDQADDDGDGVGNPCDVCPDTPFGSLVRRDVGCALAQECPCSGPTPDEEWEGPRAYVQCVARHLKQLRRQGDLDRAEIRLLLQDAVRSGCGRRVLAMR